MPRLTLAVALGLAALARGQELAAFKAPTSVRYLGWADGGRVLAVTNNYGKGVFLYDPAVGREVDKLALDKEDVSCMAVSADGKAVAAAGVAFRNAQVRVWDAATRKPTATVTCDRPVRAIALSPDGTRLAVAAGTATDCPIDLWDLTGTAPAKTSLAGHPAAVGALAFSPDGKLLASGGGDKKVRLWDLAARTGAEAGPDRPAAVSCLAFSPDGKRLAAAHWVNGPAADSVSFFDVAGRRPDSRVLRGDGDATRALHALAFSPDGRTLATGAVGGEVRLWDLGTGKDLALLKGGHSMAVVAYSPDGKRLATGGQEMRVKVWAADPAAVRAAANPADRNTLKGHTAHVRAVAYSADGKLLATCSDDLTARLWDPATGTELRSIVVLKEGAAPPVPKPVAPKPPAKGAPKTPPPPPPVVPPPPVRYFNAVVALDLSPDGKQLAVTAGNEVKLFNTATGAPEGTLKGHTDEVTAVAYASTGKALASADKNRVILWNPARKQETARVGHTYSPVFAFTPDGTRLLSGDEAERTGAMHLTDVSTGKDLGFTLNGQTDFLQVRVSRGFTLAFSPDGKRLVVNQTVYEWATAKAITKLPPDAGIRQGQPLRFSPDGRLLACGTNRGAGLWDATTGKEVARLDLDREVEPTKTWAPQVAWSPDGKTLAITGPGRSERDAAQTPTVGRGVKPPADWSVKLWDVSPYRPSAEK